MSFLRKIFKRGAGQARTTEENRQVPIPVAQKQEKEDGKKTGKIGGGVLRTARTTEKTAALGKRNWYVFSVENDRNKAEVKRTVQTRYGVKVEGVRIANMPGKMRRRGRIIGWKPGFKKAMVKVKDGQTIENI